MLCQKAHTRSKSTKALSTLEATRILGYENPIAAPVQCPHCTHQANTWENGSLAPFIRVASNVDGVLSKNTSDCCPGGLCNVTFRFWFMCITALRMITETIPKKTNFQPRCARVERHSCARITLQMTEFYQPEVVFDWQVQRLPGVHVSAVPEAHTAADRGRQEASGQLPRLQPVRGKGVHSVPSHDASQGLGIHVDSEIPISCWPEGRWFSLFSKKLHTAKIIWVFCADLRQEGM